MRTLKNHTNFINSPPADQSHTKPAAIIPLKTIHDELSAPTWQQAMAQAVSDVSELYELLDLPLPPSLHTPKKFPLRVPRSFVAKMQKGNPNDPLLLQVLPDTLETLTVVGYSQDPLAENEQNPLKGMLHKYRSRVLITVTGACAVHCRYCFRQHFDYSDNMPNGAQIDVITDYVRADAGIDEVLLSGGDPLSLSDTKLTQLIDKLSAIPHLKTIRLHTRLPVVLPSRVTDELCQTLKGCAKNIVMVLHINHPNEIDDTLAKHCAKLRDAGVTLLNQSVLLAGINDDADTLAKLSHQLFKMQVLPYYLHVLDKVTGAAHFDVPLARAVQIYWQLLERLSGYLMPKLVQELPGVPYKTPVDIHKFRSAQ